MPVTAIKFFGFFLKTLNETFANNFLIFFVCKYKILPSNFLFFFSVIIILDPFLIAEVMKLLPSILAPLIAKKILSFFTFLLSNEIPEKKNFLNLLSTSGI